MKISIEWLKDFVQINESLDDLVNLLTDLGLEAEISPIPQELPGVVIGRIESVKKHSNADKLSVSAWSMMVGISIRLFVELQM